MPKVSVVIPCYNQGEYVDEAVKSVLDQTYQNFEIIIVDDGSTDGSGDIINEFAVRDQRIRRVDNHHNIGLARLLNKAFKLCRGELVARQDQDDVSYPQRLLEQEKYLQSHRKVGIVGSAMEIIDEEDRSMSVYRQPETDCEIHFRMLFNNAMAHGSVLFRHYLIKEHGLTYDPRFENAEDYELWTRLLQFTRAYNLSFVIS